MQRGLFVLFGPGIIVTAFVLLSAGTAWFGFTRSALRFGQTAYTQAQMTADVVRRLTLAGAVFAAIATVIVLPLQGLWICLGYYAGNSISVMARSDQIKGIPSVEEIPSLLRWDQYASTFIWINAIGLLLAYLLAFARKEISLWLMILVAGPGVLYGGCGIFGGILNTGTLLLGVADQGIDADAIKYMFTLGVAGTLYTIATFYILASPAWLGEIWLGRRRPALAR
jgi:hypothetical protein